MEDLYMNLLGRAMDKDFWRQVRERDCFEYFRSEAMKLWKKHCEVPIYALK